MRRIVATAVTTALLISCGCGGKSYDFRLSRTLEQMRYRKRLDDNLMPPAKGKAEQLLIFIRPPKSLQGPMKEFQLTALEPGKFDLADSFFEKEKKLHVLARVKRPKDTSKKKAAPKVEEVVTRGDFTADVVAILNAVYGVEIDPAKAKEERKKDINVFKHVPPFEGNGKVVQVYLNVVKNNPYEVALIFEYPRAEGAALGSKIELCLESYATGERAKRAFSGGTEEEGEPGTATPPATAF